MSSSNERAEWQRLSRDPAYLRLVEKIEAHRDTLIRNLETVSPEGLQKLQGEIAGHRYCLDKLKTMIDASR